MSGSAPHSSGEAGTGARGTGVRTFAVTGILRYTAASSLLAMTDEQQRASAVLDLASEFDERPTTFDGDNPAASRSNAAALAELNAAPHDAQVAGGTVASEAP